MKTSKGRICNFGPINKGLKLKLRRLTSSEEGGQISGIYYDALKLENGNIKAFGLTRCRYPSSVAPVIEDLPPPQLYEPTPPAMRGSMVGVSGLKPSWRMSLPSGHVPLMAAAGVWQYIMQIRRLKFSANGHHEAVILSFMIFSLMEHSTSYDFGSPRKSMILLRKLTCFQAHPFFVLMPITRISSTMYVACM